MFRSLFIYRGHWTREPTSIVCDNKQGDYIILQANTGT